MRQLSTSRIRSLLTTSIERTRIGLAAATLIVTVSACGTKENARPETAAGTASATSASSASMDSVATAANAAVGMGAMAMTGDPDHDFLRMMTDHHKGMILMAHETIESEAKLGVKPIAARLDKEQDAEMDKMTTMLEQTFKDPYAPKVTADNQAMADQLKGKSGAEYDRTFLENVIKHHEQAVKMIDAYLPTAKLPELKKMAENMKAMQSAEITEFKKRLAK